jgi:hypothetical protein
MVAICSKHGKNDKYVNICTENLGEEIAWECNTKIYLKERRWEVLTGISLHKTGYNEGPS